jgi:hypothetical protein
MGSTVSLRPSHDGIGNDRTLAIARPRSTYEKSKVSFSKTVILKVQLPEPCPKQIELRLEDDLDFTVEYLK